MSYEPLISVKRLTNIIRDFCEADPRIGAFRLGDVLGSDTTAEEALPLVMYELVSTKLIREAYGKRNKEYTVRLYCFDQRMLDNSNLEDAFSDCDNILTDLLIRMQDDQTLEEKGMFFPADKDAKLDYVIKEGKDSLIGVTMDFVINTPVVLCGSQIPDET